MDGHIYIYGVIDSWQSEEAKNYGSNSLTTVKAQVEAQPEATNFTVHIHSEGGLVYEGFAIHDYLKTLSVPVNTKIEGLCASIATVIALAGEERTMTESSDFMIHNPYGMAGGEAEDVQKYADELKRLENKIANFYSDKTKISFEDAISYMKKETFMKAEQALELGFVTKVETTMRAVALFKPQTQNSKTMAELSAKDRSWIEQGFEKIMNIINPKAKNLIVQDANGTEIDFFDLEEGQEISIGDKANVEGSPAEGDYILPSGDTYTFTDGELTTIAEANYEEEEEEENALQLQLDEANSENERLTNEITDLQNQLEASKSKFNDLSQEFTQFKNDFTAKFGDEQSTGNPPQNGRGAVSNNKKRKLFKD